MDEDLKLADDLARLAVGEVNELEDALFAAHEAIIRLSAAPSALPVGWKLVPWPPSREMMQCLYVEEWPTDRDRGHAMQRELGINSNVVPPKLECEVAFGQLERFMEVAMLSASPPADHVPDVGNMISPPEPVSGWRDIATAPRDRSIFLGAVDGVVRLVSWGKTSHVPIYGFCLADQGAEDYDLCEPSCWQPLPSPPSEPGVK
jgi:hypothetical protein